MNSSIQDTEKTGTALKTVSMRLRNTAGALQEMGEDSDGAAESITKLQQQLLELTNNKVNIMLDENTFKSTYQIVQELSSVWGDLSDVAQADITRLVSGVRQGNAFSSLMTNFADGQNAVTTSLESQNSAMKENEKYLNSISGRLSVLKANFQEVSKTLINSDLLKGIVDLGSKLLSIVNIGNGALIKIPLMITSLTLLIGLFKTLGSTILFTNIGNSFLGLKTGVIGIIPWIKEFGVALKIASAEGLTGITKLSAGLKLINFNPIILTITALIAVVVGGVAIYDKLNVTLKEQKEITAKANKEYKEAKTNLENINSELETTAKRIDELNAKDNLTFVEKDELSTLKETNTELKIRKEILDEIAKNKAQKSINENVELFDVSYKGQDFSEDEISKIQNHVNETGISAGLGIDTNNISESIVGYKEFLKLRDELINNRKLSELSKMEKGMLEDYNYQLTTIKGNLLDNADELQNIKDALSEVSYEDLTDVEKEVFDKASNGVKSILSNIQGETYKDNIFNSITSKFPEASAQLQELANKGELTTNKLTIDFEDFFDEMTKKGDISAEEVVEQFNAMVVSTDKAKSNITPLVDVLGKYQDKISLLSSAWQEMDEQGNISVETITKLIASDSDWINKLDVVNGKVILNKDTIVNSAKEVLTSQMSMLTASNETAQGFIDNYESMMQAAIGLMVVTGNVSQMQQLNSDLEANKQTLIDNNKQIKILQSLLDNLNSDNPFNIKSGSGSDSSTDTWLDAFNKEFDTLKHNLEMGKISEKEYYNTLESLNLKYFANKEKYLDKYRQYEEEVYKGRLKLEDDMYKSALSAVEEFYDKEIEKINERKDALQEEYDTRIQAIDDEISALRDKNDETDKQNDLLQKQKAYLDALNQKTSSIYHEGQGFVYEADQEKVNSTRDDYTSTLNENLQDDRVAELEKEKATLEKAFKEESNAIDDSIKTLEEYKNKWSDITDSYTDSRNKLYAAQLLGKNWEQSILDIRMDALHKFRDEYMLIQAQLANASTGGDVSVTSNVTTSKSGSLKGYSSGGVADYSGLAMLHGTKSNSETIFNATDSKKLYDVIHNNNTPDLMKNIANRIIPNVNSISMGSKQLAPSISIGNINLSGVQSVEKLADDIVAKLPNVLNQKLNSKFS